MEQLVLGGVDLSNEFEIVGVQKPVPSSVADIRTVPGTDGYAFVGADILPQPMQFTLVSKALGYTERRRQVRRLSAILNSKEPVKVAFSEDDGLYYLAVLGDPPKYQEFVKLGAMTVYMQPIHSAMYGAEHLVIVPSGGSVSFIVGGTYPTKPIVTASAVRNGSSLVWGIRLDEGDYLHIATGSSSARSVVADCQNRTLSVQGSAAIPTLDSDWLELEQGEHTLRMDNGTGAATVKWLERWL